MKFLIICLLLIYARTDTVEKKDELIELGESEKPKPSYDDISNLY